MVLAAQQVYNSWDQTDDDYGGGGICDEISREIAGIVSSNLDVEITDGGQDGDDHAYTIVYDADEAYAIDIPCHIYERGGGYNWTKIGGVQFSQQDIQITPVNRRDIAN
jgi:hypothetical protein